jgi:hypothetical protein
MRAASFSRAIERSLMLVSPRLAVVCHRERSEEPHPISANRKPRLPDFDRASLVSGSSQPVGGEGGGEAEEQQIKLGDGADPADCLVIVEGI